jgi:hypothetical protein
MESGRHLLIWSLWNATFALRTSRGESRPARHLPVTQGDDNVGCVQRLAVRSFITMFCSGRTRCCIRKLVNSKGLDIRKVWSRQPEEKRDPGSISLPVRCPKDLDGTFCPPCSVDVQIAIVTRACKEILAWMDSTPNYYAQTRASRICTLPSVCRTPKLRALIAVRPRLSKNIPQERSRTHISLILGCRTSISEHPCPRKKHQRLQV